MPKERKSNMKFKKCMILFVTLALSAVSSTAVLAEDANEKVSGNIQVNVGNELRQDVRGWGVTNTCQFYIRKDHRAGDSQTFHELGATILRYDLLTETGNADGSINEWYVDVLCDIIEQGIDNGISQYMFSVWKPPADIDDDGYARWVVNVFDYISKKRNMPLPVAFSMQNEPSMANMAWTTNTYTAETYVKRFLVLNDALEKAGYGDVKLLATESANISEAEIQLGKDFNQFEVHPEFYKAIDAYCFHGYGNEAVGNQVSKQEANVARRLVELMNKYPKDERWQTEYCTIYRTKSEDQLIPVAQCFNGQMEYFGYQWWFYWGSYGLNDSPMLNNENYSDYGVLYWGVPYKKAEMNRRGQFFSTVFKNVPVGSRVAPISIGGTQAEHGSFDGEARYMDVCAFDTNHGSVVIFVNQNYEEKTYDFNNLTGVGAKIYTWESPDKRMTSPEDLQITNGSLKNITLPARSTNVIVCDNQDIFAPLVEQVYDNSLYYDGTKYVTAQKEFNVNLTVNEPVTAKVNGKPVAVNADNTITLNVNTNGGYKEYKIEAIDKCGNKTQKVLKYQFVDGFIGNITDIPRKYNSKEYVISGTATKQCKVSALGKTVETDEHGKYQLPITLNDGENKFSVILDDGDKQTEFKYAIDVDSEPLEIDVLSDSDVTLDDYEYVIRFETSKDISKLLINGRTLNDSATEYINNSDNGNRYDITYMLEDGENTITVHAEDEFGNVCDKTLKLNYVPDDRIAIRDDGELDIKHTTTDIKIDGIIDEKDWVLNKKLKYDYESIASDRFNFDVLWDENYLYIAGREEDISYIHVSDMLHYNDSVEIYLDGSNAKSGFYTDDCYQIKFGQLDDGSWQQNTAIEGIEYAMVEDGKGGYTIEAKIPWEAAKIYGIAPGKQVGFDLDINNPRSATLRPNYQKTAYECDRSVRHWNADSEAWHSTNAFGTLTLVQ